LPHQVFVSHSTKDKPVADAVCAALEAAGIGAWIAPRDIRAGSDWGQAIVEAINGSRAMVLVFSSAADASKQVLREVERAVAKGVVVVPLRIDDQMPTGSYEYFLSSTHWLDARRAPLADHLPLLVSTVHDALADPVGAQRHAGDLAQARSAAERGEPQALHALALRQLKGDGVAADPESGLRSLTRAAEQGLALAQHDLAALHEARAELGTAFRWYSRAARLGHAPAQERLAHWRDGVVETFGDEESDEPAAVASPSSDAAPLARRWLPIVTAAGAVVVAAWLWRDALVGPDRAAIGTAALTTQLDAGEPEVVVELAARAARGDAEAELALARAYDHGRGLAHDPLAVLAGYRRAAERGSVAAALVLGRAAELGLSGAPVDAAEAARWYAAAAEGGSAEGEFHGARLKADAGDEDAAVAALTRAAEHGHAEAALRLAKCYAQGLGVARDAAIAARWRERGLVLAGIR